MGRFFNGLLPAGRAIAVLAMLGGCSESGRKIDPATVASFRAGQTTYAEVIAAMGEPTTTRYMPNGGRVIAYAHAALALRPTTFIPVVGLFAGGGNMRTESVAFVFGPDSILQGRH